MKHDQGGGSGMIWLMVLCCVAMVAIILLIGFGEWSLR